MAVLRNGQALPASFDVSNVPAFLSTYIDKTAKTAKLSDTQVLFLFELQTTNLADANADFNDLCMIVNVSAK